MYYKLEPKLTNNIMMIDQVSHWDYSLTLGDILPKNTPEPMHYNIDTEINEFSYLPITFLPEPVFSVKFIQALRNAGVNNLDTYEVKITNPDTGEEIHGYQAVNIIGTISCAVMDASQSDRIIEDQHIFRKLVIDPSRARGFYLFRLAESTQDILIHERVVKRFPTKLVKDFCLEPVDEIVDD